MGVGGRGRGGGGGKTTGLNRVSTGQFCRVHGDLKEGGAVQVQTGVSAYTIRNGKVMREYEYEYYKL